MVVGTMNNAGTVLLTVADMSVIEAEVEVDETDVPFVQMGQAAKIEIDAIPDRDSGTRHGDWQQPDSDPGAKHHANGHQLQGRDDDRRPDSGCRPGFYVHGRNHDRP